MIRKTTAALLVAAGLAGGVAADAAAATGAAGLGPSATGTTGGAGLVASVSSKPKAKPKPKPKPAVKKTKPKAKAKAKRKPKPRRKPKPKPTVSKPAKPKTTSATIPTAPTGSVTGAAILAYAEQFTSTPYVYGGNGPKTFDCSGFTSYVFAHFGYQLDRTSYDQMKEGTAVHGSLEVGDLVFWDDGGHVGIYAGNNTFISATVHKGIWTYSFDVWKQTQTYTTARRILGDSALTGANAGTGGTNATAARVMPRNGGPADATP